MQARHIPRHSTGPKPAPPEECTSARAHAQALAGFWVRAASGSTCSKNFLLGPPRACPCLPHPALKDSQPTLKKLPTSYSMLPRVLITPFDHSSCPYEPLPAASMPLRSITIDGRRKQTARVKTSNAAGLPLFTDSVGVCATAPLTTTRETTLHVLLAQHALRLPSATKNVQVA